MNTLELLFYHFLKNEINLPTIAAFVDCISDLSSAIWVVAVGKSGVSDISAILSDLSTGCGNKENAAHTKSGNRGKIKDWTS